LANTKQALKRSRQSEKHRQDNKWQMTKMNTYLKKVLEAIKSGDKNQAATVYKEAISITDKMVTKGLIHANKAARHKSRLNKHIVNMA